MMVERGLSLDHTTIYRWVQRYAPEIDKRSRPYLKQTNDSWRVDETYVKVKGQWMYLYRAVDSTGQTLDFLLNQTRSTRAAKRFFRKVLGSAHITTPRVINVDKNFTYIGAVRDLKREKLFPEKCKRRPSQYMNNIIERSSPFSVHDAGKLGVGRGDGRTSTNKAQLFFPRYRSHAGPGSSLLHRGLRNGNTTIRRMGEHGGKRSEC
jgi:hypothetical protein